MRVRWGSFASAGTLCLALACGPGQSQPEAPEASRSVTASTATHTLDNTDAAAACKQLFLDGWTGNGNLIDVGPDKQLDLKSHPSHHSYDESPGTESGCTYVKVAPAAPSITTESATCPS